MSVLAWQLGAILPGEQQRYETGSMRLLTTEGHFCFFKLSHCFDIYLENIGEI